MSNLDVKVGILDLALNSTCSLIVWVKGFFLSIYRHMILIPSIFKVQSIYSTLTEEETSIIPE